MSIITFYSYKGGVGRSMALANVAVLLARQGRRVLVVDWDLEAPGIEKYFADLRISQSGSGLLRMLGEVAAGNQPDYANFTWTVTALDGTLEFKFLHAGREADPEYFELLECFEWSTFFQKGGGNFLEELRERWLKDFEFVLIDSRTGLSDSGGICTIQLPDIIVALFTPAHQSLFGVRDVIRLAQAARHRLAYDRDALSVVPVPSRVDRKQPSFVKWIEEFAAELNEFFADWLPKRADRAKALERLALDHSPAVFHGERLSVHPADHETAMLATTYTKLATLLATDLNDVSPVTEDAAGALPSKPPAKPRRVGKRTASQPGTPGYEFDIYVSYPRTEMVTQWLVGHFLPVLRGYLGEETGREMSIFLDKAELALGDEWVARQRRALQQSRIMLGIWSPSYFRSRWCLAEFETFQRRSQLLSGLPHMLFVPVVINNRATLPEAARRYQWLDMTEYLVTGKAFRESPTYLAFEGQVQKLSMRLAELLQKAPPFHSDWPVVEPKEVETPEASVPKFPRL